MDYRHINCSKCGSKYGLLTLKLVPSGNPSPYPKYLPRVKQSCANCGAYIKFVEQTPEMIDLINEQLEETPWNYEN